MAAREKYENTSKAKAKADTIAQQILTQQGYNAVKAKVAPTPKPKATVKPNIKAAEAAFQKMIKAGQVKDLEKARQQIKEKYGVRPNGMTN